MFPHPLRYRRLNGPGGGQFLQARGEMSPSPFAQRRLWLRLPEGEPALPIPIASALARLRDRARQCRRAAWKMEPSPARAALERMALRWDVIAEAERRQVERATAANDA